MFWDRAFNWLAMVPITLTMCGCQPQTLTRTEVDLNVETFKIIHSVGEIQIAYVYSKIVVDKV